METRLKLRVIVALVLLASGQPVSPAFANSWRCGPRIIAEGDGIDDVYARCGMPTYRAATTELVTTRIARDVVVTRAVAIDTWTYDPGPKQFVRQLTFRDGTLVQIDEGSYGH